MMNKNDINCQNKACKNRFQVVFEHTRRPHVAECPECKTETFFQFDYNRVVSMIPTDAVIGTPV